MRKKVHQCEHIYSHLIATPFPTLEPNVVCRDLGMPRTQDDHTQGCVPHVLTFGGVSLNPSSSHITVLLVLPVQRERVREPRPGGGFGRQHQHTADSRLRRLMLRSVGCHGNEKNFTLPNNWPRQCSSGARSQGPGPRAQGPGPRLGS